MDLFDESPIIHCELCGTGIYANDKYFDILGYVICEECICESTRYAIAEE